MLHTNMEATEWQMKIKSTVTINDKHAFERGKVPVLCTEPLVGRPVRVIFISTFTTIHNAVAAAVHPQCTPLIPLH